MCSCHKLMHAVLVVVASQQVALVPVGHVKVIRTQII